MCCHSPALSRLFLFIYVLLSVFFAAPFPYFTLSRKLMRAYDKALSPCSLSLALSDVPTSVHAVTTARTNGFHFHCAAHSPPPRTDCTPCRATPHHALSRFYFASFRSRSRARVRSRSRLCLASLRSALLCSALCSDLLEFAIFSFSQRKYGARSGCDSKCAP